VQLPRELCLSALYSAALQLCLGNYVSRLYIVAHCRIPIPFREFCNADLYSAALQNSLKGNLQKKSKKKIIEKKIAESPRQLCIVELPREFAIGRQLHNCLGNCTIALPKLHNFR
jgi:hypothetical protein